MKLNITNENKSIPASIESPSEITDILVLHLQDRAVICVKTPRIMQSGEHVLDRIEFEHDQVDAAQVGLESFSAPIPSWFADL